MTDYTNRGAAWRNKDRERESQPHCKGTLNVEGAEYWWNVWLNPEATGDTPLIKCSVQRKESIPDITPEGKESGMAKLQDTLSQIAGAPPQEQPAAAKPPKDFDDDIPF